MPVSTRPQPIDVLWQPATLVSIFTAGELLAIILALAPAASESRLVAFGLLSFAIQWVTLFTLAAMYTVREWLKRLRAGWIVMVALTLMLGFSLASARMARGLLGPLWTQNDAAWPGPEARFAATLFAMALLGLLALRARWNAQRLAYAANEAELQALHARIRPHFLFNALNAGAALVHARPEQAERLLLDLADLFRAALTGPRTVSLAEELSLAQRYLDIETMRFGSRLRIHWDVDEPVPEAVLPVLSLQPLVENAVRHGVEPAPEGGEVSVRVTADAACVTVCISNTLPVAAPRTDGHRVGLLASRVRIEAESGGAGNVHTRIEHGRFIATVHLPLNPQVTTR